ncbi:hypothetical protein DHC50_15930 [Arenibacter sp. A80]|jgi:hypothetical protein|nr:hypothetical protein [Arenibacter sp. A80]RFT55488.1 hypothetical protein D0S24_15925 [Arenibacter sp. P308M17]
MGEKKALLENRERRIRKSKEKRQGSFKINPPNLKGLSMDLSFIRCPYQPLPLPSPHKVSRALTVL